MNIGVIGIRGAWSTESLSKHLQQKNAGGAVIELGEISYGLVDGSWFHPQYELASFDGFILKKMGREYSPGLMDELELLELMERRGFRFFSSPKKIRRMISRLSCTLRLREQQIPMPPTFISESIDAAVAWAVENAPVILKPLYSTKARGMALLEDEQTAREKITALVESGEKVIYLQQKYELDGSDYGLVFLAGNYVGAYARVGDGRTWHTTTREGGTYAPFEPSQALIDLARRAQAPFGLDFTCVDIADSREAGPIVFEVSAFGGYKGLFRSTGLDASDMLTDFAISQLGHES